MDEVVDIPKNAFDDEQFAKEANASIDLVFNIFSSIVGNIASNLAPLTAGILPAYLTYHHIRFTLEYDPWVAWAGAITVEFLGLGSGNELMKIWFHNKHIAKVPEEKLPLLNAGISTTWYVLIMVIFNVILEADPESSFWRITAIALFATLALPGYMLVSGRTLRIQMEQNAERIAFEQAEAQRIADENRVAQERYALEHAQNAAQAIASQQAENERLQKAAELDAQLKIQEMKHRQKMEKIALELRLEEERTSRKALELSETSRNDAETFRNFPKGQTDGSESFGNLPTDWRSLRPTLGTDGLKFWASINPTQVKELSATYKVDVKTITNWRSRSIAELEAMQQNNEPQNTEKESLDEH